MQTRFGNIEGLYPQVLNLSHNLTTNEITGTIVYYLSAEEALSGQFTPVHQQPVSWIADGDHSLTLQEAIDRVTT